MKLSDTNTERFAILEGAFQVGQVALMDVQRKSDGKSVAVICTYVENGDGYQFVPVAEMIEGNPFDGYNPPNQGGEGYVGQEGQDGEETKGA